MDSLTGVTKTPHFKERDACDDAEPQRYHGVRAGVVGAGLMGRWHAAVIERTGSMVAAVSDHDPNAAQRLTAAHRTATVFPGVAEMLESGHIDVIHICTPLASHYNLADMALRAGVHILMEKPLTPCAEDTAALLKTAKQQNVLLCPVHQFMFQDGVRFAQQSLPRIGKILHLEATFYSAGGGGFASDDAAIGGARLDGVVADILPHPLSLFQMFLPGCLPREGWFSQRPAPGEMRAFVQSGEVTASVFISMNARPTQCALKIAGTEGTIHLDLFHGYAFLEAGTVSRTRKIGQPFTRSGQSLGAAAVNLAKRAATREAAYPGLRRLVGDFHQAVAAAVRTNCSPLPSPILPEDVLAVAQVRDILLEQTGLFCLPETIPKGGLK